MILGRYLMDGLGLDAAKDFEPVYLERAGDGPAMVLDGRVAALWGGGAGWPGFMTVTSAPDAGRFIVPTAEERTRVLARHGFLKTITQPAGSFPGQDAPVVSVGSWSFVMARPVSTRRWPCASPRRCMPPRPALQNSSPRRRRRTRWPRSAIKTCCILGSGPTIGRPDWPQSRRNLRASRAFYPDNNAQEPP
ncbi:MAG: hypothetical protein JSR24_05770 [Proteobacteria bacterium]|nr:hypothetical protein [Pseudomonadota bacterium]